MSMRFEELGLSGELLQAVKEMGFEEASPIQEMAIPPLLAGRDVIGQAQTGTGKTAAFGIPLLEGIDPRDRAPQALVLCPTRELTVQVADEINRLAARKRGVFALAVYGGQPIERQMRALDKGAQVIVGTPGRILDHLQRGTLRFARVFLSVLDEADEMLDMGFREDIEAILAQTPPGCRRAFFSATMPADIMELARRFLKDPQILKVTGKRLTVPGIEQAYYEVAAHRKIEDLRLLLDSQGFHKALIFCSTRRGVDEVAMHLQMCGYQADALHGDLAQSQRDRVMGRFRSDGLELLVATDVAARGLDVEDVDAVINYDIPNDAENYVHRIGRTGRAGRPGRAFTFVSPRDRYKLRDIIRCSGAQITLSRLPSPRDAADIRVARLLDKVRATIEAGALERCAAIVERFADEGVSGADMAAALLKLLMRREAIPHPARQSFSADAQRRDATSHPHRRAQGAEAQRRDAPCRPHRRAQGADALTERREKGKLRRHDGVSQRSRKG
jgi:ATP-dependent RNA helicase DeaD